MGLRFLPLYIGGICAMCIHACLSVAGVHCPHLSGLGVGLTPYHLPATSSLYWQEAKQLGEFTRSGEFSCKTYKIVCCSSCSLIFCILFMFAAPGQTTTKHEISVVVRKVKNFTI